MKTEPRIETFEGWLARFRPHCPVTQELYHDYLMWQMGLVERKEQVSLIGAKTR